MQQHHRLPFSTFLNVVHRVLPNKLPKTLLRSLRSSLSTSPRSKGVLSIWLGNHTAYVLYFWSYIQIWRSQKEHYTGTIYPTLCFCSLWPECHACWERLSTDQPYVGHHRYVPLSIHHCYADSYLAQVMELPTLSPWQMHITIWHVPLPLCLRYLTLGLPRSPAFLLKRFLLILSSCVRMKKAVRSVF